MHGEAPYHFLAEVYDAGWRDYSEYIYQLIREIESESRRTFHRICDAACGTGALIGLLAADEYDRSVYGYDRSAEMLSIAKDRVPNAEFRHGYLEKGIPVAGPFDLITCVYDSLNYLLEEEELTRFFAVARERIADDGLLLVDLNARALYRERTGERRTRLIDGVPLRQALTYDDGPPPRATTVFAFEYGREEHVQRPWDPEEVRTLLAHTGWSLLETLDVLDEDTDEASGKIVYTAVPTTNASDFGTL